MPDWTGISKSTTAQAPSPCGEGWGEVEEAPPPPKPVPDVPEKHRQEVAIAGSLRRRRRGQLIPSTVRDWFGSWGELQIPPSDKGLHKGRIETKFSFR